jgi:uncharacterized protein
VVTAQSGFDRLANGKFEDFRCNLLLTHVPLILNFALPNFYFYVATAHDILRHNGPPIGKREYLGFGRE